MALFARRQKFVGYFETEAREAGGYEFDEDLDDLEEGELPLGEPYYVGGSATFRDAHAILELLRKSRLVHVTETIAPDSSISLSRDTGAGWHFGHELSLHGPGLRGRAYGFFGKRVPDLTDLDIVREDCDFTIDIQVWGRASDEAELGGLPCGIQRAKVGENREVGVLIGGDNWALWVSSTKGLSDSQALLALDIIDSLGQGIIFWNRYGNAPYLVPHLRPQEAYDVYRAGSHPQHLTAIIDSASRTIPASQLPDIAGTGLERQVCGLIFGWVPSGYIYHPDIPVGVVYYPEIKGKTTESARALAAYATAIRKADPSAFALQNDDSHFVLHLHPTAPGEAEMARIAVDYFQTQLGGNIIAPVLAASGPPVQLTGHPKPTNEVVTPSEPLYWPESD